jgi:hypothetical protein
LEAEPTAVGGEACSRIRLEAKALNLSPRQITTAGDMLQTYSEALLKPDAAKGARRDERCRLWMDTT